MGKFNGVRLTNKGLKLQAKAQTGIPLVINEIIIGDGYIPDNTEIEKLTELINPISIKADIIGNKVIGDGYSQLEARITSGDNGFYLREVGIIATDPDEGKILYAYTNAGDYADYIPSADDNITTQDLVLITEIGNAENLKINVTLDAEVRREEFNEHTSNTSNPHSVTKEQVGLGNVENVQQATKAEFDVHTSNTSNPHSVTKEQVGLGNVENVQQATKAEFDVHTSNINNPHAVTKEQVGLGNVENKSSATIRSEITKENVTTALGYTPPDSDTNTTYGLSISGHTVTLVEGGTSKSVTVPDNDTTYSNATTSTAGLMSASDKSKLDGIESNANNYSHPTYTAKSSGLYKVTVDSTGHVSGATAVTKSDITALGIPSADTDTHYTSKNIVGNSSDTADATSVVTNGNVYLKHVDGGAMTSRHKISGAGATTVTTDTSANIIITSTDTVRSSYTLIFAASNSSNEDKARADVVLSGSDDRAEIMAAINALSTNRNCKAHFYAGTYNLKVNSVWDGVNWGGSGKYIGIYAGAGNRIKKISGAGVNTVFNISSDITNQPIYGIYTNCGVIVENLQLKTNVLSGVSSICLLDLEDYSKGRDIFFNVSCASNVAKYFIIGVSCSLCDSINLSASDTSCPSNIPTGDIYYRSTLNNFTSMDLAANICCKDRYAKITNCSNINITLSSTVTGCVVTNNTQSVTNSVSGNIIANNT